MANIHSFESLAALDGEGIRYAVFFTRCPLRCVYCHNPDTWHAGEIEMSAAELFDKIKRYKPYFKNGGGVTFSGGEPLLSSRFINETCRLLKTENIGYCIDTSGSVRLDDEVKTALLNADMVILDIKFHNEADYKKYTGGDFSLPAEIGKFCSDNGKRLMLRSVIIPGINDSEGDIKGYADYVKNLGLRFEKYELLAFHTMGFFKYDELGIDNPLKDTPPLDKEKLNALQDLLNSRLNGEKYVSDRQTD